MKTSATTILASLASVGLAATTQKFTTNDGTNYAYDYAPAGNHSMPTVLFIHGFPSSRHDWHHQVAHLEASGYGALAIDCLGYGDSDRPTYLAAYTSKRMAGHIAEIVDNEGLESVVGVGHDWGAGVLSKTWNWHPEIFEKLVFMSVPYTAAKSVIDVDAINHQTLNSLGYAEYGYWYFFNTWDAGDVIANNVESFFHLVYHTNASAWGHDLADIGSARAWLGANKTTAIPPWMTQADKDLWVSQWKQPNTTHAGINYYRMSMRGRDVEDEKSLGQKDLVIDVPVMAIGGSEDQITLAATMAPATTPYASAGFEMHTLDAGHWLMLEQHKQVSELVAGFAARD